MNIKEIALKVAKEMPYGFIWDENCGHETGIIAQEAIAFAESLIAEVQRQNEPVAYRWQEKGRWLSWYVDWTWHDKAKELGFPVEYAYTFPPSIEANALAKYEEFMADSIEPDPVEKLRFFLSLALTGKNWIDSEKFLTAIHTHIEAERENVAEACAALVEEGTRISRTSLSSILQDDAVYPDTNAEAIRSGEWRRFVNNDSAGKEVKW